MTQSQTTLEKAMAFHQQGELAQAKAMYEAILIAEPKHAEVLHLLGVIAFQSNNLQQAIDYYNRAIAINPDYANAYSNRGLAQQGLKQLAAAVASYDCAIALKPHHADIHFNRGLALQELNQCEEAIASYSKAITIKPDFAQAYVNRGKALGELKQFATSISEYDQAIRINPNLAEAHFNRGLALQELKQLHAALASYDQAITSKPDFVEAHFNRGNTLRELKQSTEALASYDRAITIKPDYADAYWSKSLVLLSIGDLQKGWDLYEWRSQLKNVNFHPIKLINEWNGEKLAGSLLILSEQGIGDEIFYSGMLHDICALADSVTVCVDPRLVPLYQRSFKQINFISPASLTNIAMFDAQLYMPSLGRYCRADLSSLQKVKTPYLKACSEKSKALRNKLKEDKKLLCGISWISKNASSGLEKTLQLDHLKSILSLPDIEFVDLQYGNTDAEQAAFYDETNIRLKRIPKIDNFHDIDGLAALIEACDIVLTVSNTTAHLACALGKTTIIMLPYAKGLHWYWHEESDKTPWYPTATLVRQNKSDNWENVVEQAKLISESEIKMR